MTKLIIIRKALISINNCIQNINLSIDKDVSILMNKAIGRLDLLSELDLISSSDYHYILSCIENNTSLTSMKIDQLSSSEGLDDLILEINNQHPNKRGKKFYDNFFRDKLYELLDHNIITYKQLGYLSTCFLCNKEANKDLV